MKLTIGSQKTEKKEAAAIREFIAARSFRNNRPELINVKEPLHANHVHKGGRLTIDMGEPDADELVYLLNHSGCLIDPNDEESVKRLNEEIEFERKRDEADKARAEAAAADPILKFREMLAQIVVNPNASTKR